MTKKRKKNKDLLQDGVRPRAALDWLCAKAVCFVDWAHTSFSPRENSEVSPRGGSCGTATTHHPTAPTTTKPNQTKQTSKTPSATLDSTHSSAPVFRRFGKAHRMSITSLNTEH